MKAKNDRSNSSTAKSNFMSVLLDCHMFFRWFNFLLTGVMLLFMAACSKQITLVKDGESLSAVVLPENPSREVQGAAVELQTYIEKCTGAKLTVLKESQLEEQENQSESYIFIGPCKKTEEVTDMENLKPEELLILTHGSNLFLTGGEGGTKYAVYEWLRKYMGVEWIFPGEIGEVTPSVSSVKISDIDYRYQPVVKSRELRNVPVNGHTLTGLGRISEKTGAENADVVISKAREFYQVQNIGYVGSKPDPIFSRWGGGERISLRHGHSYNDYWEKYGKEHPDFFALQPNGSREQNPERERLCVSNPDLWEFVAQRKIEEFEENPQQEMASLCPNDGGANKFCMCDQCRSWDPPDAPKIHDPKLVDPATGNVFEEYPSLSDRYFRFYNEVAERVARVCPDKKLGVYAYSVYRTVPVNIKKLHPGISVELVSLDRELIDDWSEIIEFGQLSLRPNTMGPGGSYGFAGNTARWHAENVKYAIDKGARAFDFDKCAWNWGTQGLEYYVLVRVMWDPSADPDKLIEDYCRAAYGEGASTMQKYHQKLEELTNRIREEGRYKGRKNNPEILVEYYTDELLAELQGYIDEAKSAVGNDSSGEYKRIQVVGGGLDYTTKGIELLKLASTTDTREPAYQDAEKEFFQYLKANIGSYSFNAGMSGAFYYYSALRRAGR
jgi:hypothetical protein